MIGKILCDLVPDSTNERNSEGAFLPLQNGDILFAYTRYRNGGFDDHCTADIYGLLSHDGGESFGHPFPLLLCEDAGADNVMSVSLLRMQNGDLGMFYLRKDNTAHTCIPCLTRSADEGKTWSTATRCIPEEGYYVLNNDRVIALSDGRLLMPVAKHLYQAGTYLPGEVHIYASDDDGYTWHLLSDAIRLHPYAPARPSFPALHNAMEPGLVQREDGTVWCYIRTALGRQYETFSHDRGCTWSVPQPSPFTSAVSPMSVKRLASGNLLAVWNPVPLHNGKSEFIGDVWTGARTPLVFALLDGQGEPTGAYRVLEADEQSGFCYCAIHELPNGDILLGYCAGGVADKNCLNRCRIRRIPQRELSPSTRKL